jgi:hypothetical protein
VSDFDHDLLGLSWSRCLFLDNDFVLALRSFDDFDLLWFDNVFIFLDNELILALRCYNGFNLLRVDIISSHFLDDVLRR